MAETSTTMMEDKGNEIDDSTASILANLEATIAHFSDGNDTFGFGDMLDDDGTINIQTKFAPPGLETQWKQLYGVVSSGSSIMGLNGSNSSPNTTSSAAAAAIVMGPRGSGKSLLLERCLAALEYQQQHQNSENNSTPPKQKLLPRRVTIHGILSKGHDVTSVVFEIIRQLSELAFLEGSSNAEHDDGNDGNNNPTDTPTTRQKRKRRKRYHHDKHLLRLRQNSNFTSNLQLLEEVLRVADADGIPILLVLDELDAFLSTVSVSSSSAESTTSHNQKSHHHQLLLYLLLDRVATPGSNLILVMMTSSFSCLSLLEKRIRSRAEGTCQVIYTSGGGSYQEMVSSVLKSKLSKCVVGPQILARISYNLDNNNSDSNSTITILPESERQEAAHITQTMERQFRLGKDVRWFSRVLSTALALFRQDYCIMNDTTDAMTSFKFPHFHCRYLQTALVMMGATAIGSDVVNSSNTSSSTATAATRQPDVCVVSSSHVNGNTIMAVDPRLQALFDLSTPQLALLLSAKRILTRQSHLRGNGREHEHGSCHGNNSSNSSNGNKTKKHASTASSLPAPLTVDRMMHEYESFRKRSSTSVSAYSKALWKKAALQLLQVGLLVPVETVSSNYNNSNNNNSMTAPALYYKKAAMKSYRNLDTSTLMGGLSLNIPLEMDRELAKALSSGALLCPTALSEWGKAANN